MKGLIFKSIIISNFLISCHGQTMKEVYQKENLPREVKGRVISTILYKGGGLSLNIKTSNTRNTEIAISGGVQPIVKKGDYFIKEKNSNKCSIKRNDSILYCDCYSIPVETRRQLGSIKEWPKNVKDKWQKIK